jgi:gamma-glutamylcyclotransferase (GGCT)/AIG2-like uncharacterized protein YtfP
MLYFAYGHNTNDKEMWKRLPHALKVGKGWLDGYDLILYKYANAERGHGMAGVVWELTEDEMAQLDKYEEVPDVYLRKTVTIELDGKRRRAQIYVMARPIYGVPSKQYMKWLEKGYVQNKLWR